MKKGTIAALLTAICGLALLAAGAQVNVEVNQDWLKHVPAAERDREKPDAGKPDAIAAGKRLFDDHCAQCHGADLMGRHGKPSLLTPAVRAMTGGELQWLLKNGDLRHGMPSWSSLPEPERWQIVAYVKDAGTATLGR